mmetsp:Transcript_192/g.512  ORF Transcript_192/g.512 Transcript_192/m.512 type:complete len:251 (-) Transcript_192:7-759(-)
MQASHPDHDLAIRVGNDAQFIFHGLPQRYRLLVVGIFQMQRRLVGLHQRRLDRDIEAVLFNVLFKSVGAFGIAQPLAQPSFLDAAEQDVRHDVGNLIHDGPVVVQQQAVPCAACGGGRRRREKEMQQIVAIHRLQQTRRLVDGQWRLLLLRRLELRKEWDAALRRRTVGVNHDANGSCVCCLVHLHDAACLDDVAQRAPTKDGHGGAQRGFRCKCDHHRRWIVALVQYLSSMRRAGEREGEEGSPCLEVW